jgi:hypothetical protein
VTGFQIVFRQPAPELASEMRVRLSGMGFRVEHLDMAQLARQEVPDSAPVVTYLCQALARHGVVVLVDGAAPSAQTAVVAGGDALTVDITGTGAAEGEPRAEADRITRELLERGLLGDSDQEAVLRRLQSIGYLG